MIEQTVKLDEHSCRRALAIGQFYGGNTLQGSAILAIQVLYDWLERTEPDFVAMLEQAKEEGASPNE